MPKRVGKATRTDKCLRRAAQGIFFGPPASSLLNIFAIKSAWMFKVGRVIALDRVPERLKLSQEQGKAEVIDLSRHDAHEQLQEMTLGIRPDR